jgi:xanthine dehydrogenase accessory factor
MLLVYVLAIVPSYGQHPTGTPCGRTTATCDDCQNEQMAHPTAENDADAVAHGTAQPEATTRTLVAIFASPVAEYLLRYASDVGYRTVLLEPDKNKATRAETEAKIVTSIKEANPDKDTDVVMCDHHREELGEQLKEALASKARWIGLMGNPNHQGPHQEALTALNVPQEEIDRIHRPIGLNIGSRRPAEIAISTLAGLLANRNNRPGGFKF